jgi:MSHA biogenesis protein MshJ
MSQRLQQFEEWINTLSLRERGLMIIAVIAVVYFIWDQALFAPLEVRAKELGEQVQKQQANLKTVRDQQRQILERAGADPDAAVRKEIASIEKLVAQLDRQLQTMTVDLVDPQQMAVLLEEVLTRKTDLKLVSVAALPPQPLGETLSEGEPAAEVTEEAQPRVLPGVYQHTLQIEFSGSYRSTLEYIKELEALDQRFFWHSVDFAVKDYPHATVVIRVNTLSLSDAWIGV